MISGLLVPNVGRGPGFAICCLLRPQVTKLLTTNDGNEENFLYSRLYDFQCQILAPDTVKLHPTPHDLCIERKYVEAVIAFCILHGVELVWPVNDRDILCFSRNRQVFKAASIQVIVAELEHLFVTLDKARLLQEAQRLRFRHPSFLVRPSDVEARNFAQSLGYPLVSKEIQSTGSDGVKHLHSPKDLERFLRSRPNGDREFVIQEWLCGKREISYHFLIDKESDVVSRRFAVLKCRHLAPSHSTALEIVDDRENLDRVERFIRDLDLNGFVVVQTRISPVDGVAQLIEINNRPGNNSRILFCMDTDLAGDIVRTALTHYVQPKVLPIGLVGASPVEDLLAAIPLISCRSPLSRGSLRGNVMFVLSLVKSYYRFYRRGPTTDTYFEHFLREPLMISRYFASRLKYVTPMGRRRRQFRLVAQSFD